MCSTTYRATPSAYAVSEPTCTNPARVTTLAEPTLCSATRENNGLVDDESGSGIN